MESGRLGVGTADVWVGGASGDTPEPGGTGVGGALISRSRGVREERASEEEAVGVFEEGG